MIATEIDGATVPMAPRPRGAPLPVGHRWARRNRRLLALFGPLLIATGIAGLCLPARLSLMSDAIPYDVFHLVAGAIGTAFVLARSARLAALFNLVFGAIDLYQAAAGVTGIFPARIFALRPADHVVHVALGGLLLFFGARFFAAPKSGGPTDRAVSGP
jgi:hypothetical protein